MDCCQDQACCSAPLPQPRAIVWLQLATLAWMLIECSVALYGALQSHSAVLLAFGSDSFVELLSATLVLAALSPRLQIGRERSSRWAGILLFVLAGVVAAVAILSFVQHTAVETSGAGLAITVAALIIMPVLAWFKRRLARRTNNPTLAADAVQSATCAWLAAGTLVSLATNAFFHLRWIDSISAFAVLPILIVEGRRALRGESCGCC